MRHSVRVVFSRFVPPSNLCSKVPYPRYQLRRLRLHALIERIPKTHRYQLTDFGFRVAIFCTRTYARILRPGLGLVMPLTSSFPTPLRRSFDKIEQEISSWVNQAKLAA